MQLMLDAMVLCLNALLQLHKESEELELLKC